MISRRSILALSAGSLSGQAGFPFSRPLGLQLYSLRNQAAKDLAGTLALVRKMGFTELEVGDLYGRSAGDFQRMLREAGLKASSVGVEWDKLTESTARAADTARTLGAEFVMCSAIPRKKRLTGDDVSRAAENFNRWGEALAGAGLRFCYHAHGPEFVSGPDGTLFDTLAKRMDPKWANFEMDVFWVVFGNQDPVKLLKRYSGRFPLMHVKDIRKGVARTFDPGTVAEEDSVPLGTGEIDWAPVLQAAREAGVERYYIEEEHPDAVNQIRQSLRYLERLRF